VDKRRLREALNRTHQRLEHEEMLTDHTAQVSAAVDAYESAAKPRFLERIPVRRRSEVIIVPARQIASIVAEGELLHLTTTKGERHVISHRLRELEARLDPDQFIRLGRGTLANVESIVKVSMMPGGSHIAVLTNGQKLRVSRIQSRVLRERFLKL
jgi:two-component system LytT family response regulator